MRSRHLKGFCGEGDTAQKGQGQHDQSDMPIPPNEAAYLVVIQPQVFAIRKVSFNAPASSQGRDFGVQEVLGGAKTR